MAVETTGWLGGRDGDGRASAAPGLRRLDRVFPPARRRPRAASRPAGRAVVVCADASNEAAASIAARKMASDIVITAAGRSGLGIPVGAENRSDARWRGDGLRAAATTRRPPGSARYDPPAIDELQDAQTRQHHEAGSGSGTMVIVGIRDIRPSTRVRHTRLPSFRHAGRPHHAARGESAYASCRFAPASTASEDRGMTKIMA
jgi:hypothetical protein